MTRSLRTHLLLLYVLLAVLSGVVVPALGVWLTLEGFRHYQLQRRQADLEALASSLEDLYREDGAWNRRRVMDLMRPSPQWMGMTFTLRDAGGGTVFSLAPMSMKPMGRGRGMARRGAESRASNDAAALVEQISISLSLDGGHIGTLDVEHRPPPNRFEQAFVAYLTRYTLAGASVMIAAACGLGFFVSGGLSRPVVRALERTRRIAHGDYEPEPVSPTGIREMDALSRGVEDLGRSLAGQERLRRRLMVDIAHELRTPLTVVRSQVEAIADGVWEPSPDRLALCVAEIERLSGLIEDVESLMNLEGEAIAIRMEETDLRVFLDSILDSFEPLFERSGVELRRDLAEGIRAEIDVDGFRHIIDNLLSNALRYTEAGGRAEVRLHARDGRAVIEVRDTGSGIAEADLPHIFDRFYRADESRARVTGGRGVGLAIAKAAAEAHGGTITAASRTGAGSCFTVALPLA